MILSPSSHTHTEANKHGIFYAMPNYYNVIDFEYGFENLLAEIHVAIPSIYLKVSPPHKIPLNPFPTKVPP